MSALDYIKIIGMDGERGEEIDPGAFECFQGISCGGGKGATDPISEDPDIAQALWTAQNDLIQAESDYCMEIEELFTRKKDALPQEEHFATSLLQEIIEGVGGLIVGLLVTLWTKNKKVGQVAAFVAEMAIGLAIEYLKKLYTEGKDLCEHIRAENDALLNLEQGRGNYDLRRETLRLHTEMLENLLLHIGHLESLLEQASNTNARDMIDAIQDLKYNDESVDFGSVRLHLKGKVIEY